MTLVQPGIRRDQEVAYGKNSTTGETTLYCWPEVDGVLVDPSSSSVDIYRQGELAPASIVDGVVTESVAHQLSYALDASNTATWPLGMRASAQFKFTVAGRLSTVRVFFNVVRVPLVHFPPCRAIDLLNAHAIVGRTLIQAGYVDGNGDADPSCFIIEAWEELLSWLETEGKQPGYIMNPGALSPMLRAGARAKMFDALSMQQGDIFGVKRDVEKKRYDGFYASPPTLQYDAVDSNTPAPEPARAQTQIGISGREFFRVQMPFNRIVTRRDE